MGAPVARAWTQRGGFSPGVAVRLELVDGRHLFLKAVSARANPDAPGIYRREARIAARLPPEVPAPRFLWSDEAGPWVALAFEDVEGRNPPLPWRPSDLRRVLLAWEGMVRALTPSPLRAPSLARAHGRSLRNWRTLRSELAAPGDAAERFGPWVRSHLRQLIDLEGRWEQASRGRTLLHFDVRADNVVLTRDRVYFVDWPHASVGAPWVDLLAFLPSVAMQGGPPPWRIFDRHPLAQQATPEQVDAVLAALAGLFLMRGCQPAPPGLPTLRPFQRAQGRQAIRWLRYRWEGVDPRGGSVPARPSGPG